MTTILKKEYSKKFEADQNSRNVFITAVINENKEKKLVFIDPDSSNRITYQDNKLFCYYIDGSGGTWIKIKYTYISRTQITLRGKVYSDFPIIEIGTYEVNSKNKKNIKSNSGAFLYAPIDTKNSKAGYPFVFTINSGNGSESIVLQLGLSKELEEVIELYLATNQSYSYSAYSTFKNIILKCNKEINIPFLDLSEEKTKEYKIKTIKKGANLFGVDLTLFSELNYYKHFCKETYDKEIEHPILEKKGVKRYHGDYVFLGKYQEPTHFFKANNPQDLNTMYELLEINSVRNFEYSFIDNLFIICTKYENKYYEYELLIDSSKKLVYPIEVLINDGIKNINLKIETDKQYLLEKKEKLEKVKNLLAENQENILILKDSYDVGNCEYGTKSFIKEYFGQDLEKIKIVDIINHNRLNEMLDNEQFLRVILNKFKGV